MFFDRWLEYLNRDVFLPLLGPDCNGYLNYTQGDTRTACGTVPSHSLSNDNQSAAAHKFDQNSQDVLLRAFQGQNPALVFGAGGAQAAALKAAREAAAELATAQGGNPGAWSEPVEQTCFSAQGAGSVPCYSPMQNRGSYGQVIEPLIPAAAVVTAPAGATILPNTGAPSRWVWLVLLVPLGVRALLSFGRPARE